MLLKKDETQIGGEVDISKTEREKRLSRWRIGLFKSFSFLYIYEDMSPQNIPVG